MGDVLMGIVCLDKQSEPSYSFLGLTEQFFEDAVKDVRSNVLSVSSTVKIPPS